MYKVKEYREDVTLEVDRLITKSLDAKAEIIKAAGVDIEKVRKGLDANEIADEVYDNQKLVGIVSLEIGDVYPRPIDETYTIPIVYVEINVIYKVYDGGEFLIGYIQTTC